jgi:hypothetical protein
MSHAESQNLTQHEWRVTVHDVSAQLEALPGDVTACPAHPVAAQLGERAFHVPLVDLQKAELYAAARPAIKEVAATALRGEGTETRFVPEMFPYDIMPDIAERTDLTVFLVNTLFFNLEKYMRAAGSPRFHMFKAAALAHRYHKFIPNEAITRGCLPNEVMQFGLLTAPLLQEHPLTAGKGAPERIAIAHELSSILMGRAMPNIANVGLRPELSTYVGQVDIRTVGGQHQLIGKDGAPLDAGHNLAGNVGPTLKCPAHDYLGRFIAAGVNLIGDAGYYHPDVPPDHIAPEIVISPSK